ncbi:Response regulator receiver protein [Profundibacterium mesophilum KAUST100406-0324]|uniref:Response regulator receiver protein n=2 Tax=Profundibacterium TaxID=1258570 RepID=A0A921NTJ0_9RHOB|nr:Response regulator receiver protein [Profundibacterium mesophilum KAUST100406-0324]
MNRVLIADDSRLQRRVLSSALRRWGFEVIEAASGEQAIELCTAYSPDLIVCDWMMPGMNGLEFCRAIRRLDLANYVYIILLTSKSAPGEVVQGLDAGADDFLSKPIDTTEFRARLSAGERILTIERSLSAQNRLVRDTLDRMKSVYESLDRDLIEARKLQMSLVPTRSTRHPGGQVDYLFRPSGHIGGDLVGQVPLSEGRFGIYALDVSGHGIASALITARLSGWLSGANPEHNIALTRRDGRVVIRPPHEICARLNRIFHEEIETDHYFTMVFADVDLDSGRLSIAQAGHPYPLIQRAGGEVESVGEGGMPIGLLDDAVYTSVEAHLAPGDRLFIHSDGLTECAGMTGEALGEAGLSRLVAQNAHLDGPGLLDKMTGTLAALRQSMEFEDDISGVLVARQA